ncbi:hypothetical protein [Deinococcus sp. KSM4-11]|nr:hypothetical protein [Deinococcus sp. KSM4-11]
MTTVHLWAQGSKTASGRGVAAALHVAHRSAATRRIVSGAVATVA